MSNDKQRTNSGFWAEYFSNPKSIGILLLVCGLIAIMTNAFNGLGWPTNFGFSLCFGVPISMLEAFMQTRKKPLPDMVINVLSVVLGCVFGTTMVYAYLVIQGLVPFGQIGRLFYVNFGVSFVFSASAFYFFWSRYRNQTLTLALRDQQLKAAEMTNLKQKAENRLLQAQMEPHFLFNTLANIQSLVDMNPAQAKTMIGDLSNMLRASLSYSERDECTLSQELDLVRAYLNIQKVRLGERLIVKEQIDADLSDVLILPMLIQPLVENAVRHGVETSMVPVTIQLSASKQNNQLVIRVQDDHRADRNSDRNSDRNGGFGLSLSNIQKRLQNHFTGTARVESHALDAGWLSELSLPVSRSKERV